MRFPSPHIRVALRVWNESRDHAALHRGLWIVAPVFWAAFTVFTHPGWGGAGFLIHLTLCLPRRLRAKLLLILAFPLLTLWFAAREAHLTLPQAPFHRVFTEDSEPLARTGVVVGIPVPTARGHTFHFREAYREANREANREPGGRRLLYRVTLEIPPPQWGNCVTV
jgi:hypothetical protein